MAHSGQPSWWLDDWVRLGIEGSLVWDPLYALCFFLEQDSYPLLSTGQTQETSKHD